MYFKIILIALAAYVLILIAYPETRLWLKELIKKHPFLSSSLICLVLVIIAFLYFPPFFKYVALDFWKIPLTIYSDGTVEVVELADLGSIGDIFGSLNSFISSIALCAVAVSTWLQVKSLKETREANERQLQLAKDVHDAQIKESQNAIFTTKFYGLLNFKNEKFHQLEIIVDKKQVSAHFVMLDYATHLTNLLQDEWKEVNEVNKDVLRDEYLKSMGKYDQLVTSIFSYFLIYGDIIQLIKTSSISSEDKEFFKSILSNSMLVQEQALLLWLGAIYDEIGDYLDESELINQFYGQSYIPFVRKFHKASHFKPKKWKQVFLSEETPA